MVEVGDADAVFSSPLHPYTQALLRAAPQMLVGRRNENVALAGELPSPLAIPAGCPFNRGARWLSITVAFRPRRCMPDRTVTRLNVT